MTKEDINFLISIQSLPDEEFQIAYLERELDKKENIIKEVREKTKEVLNESWYGGREKDIAREYLEILDRK